MIVDEARERLLERKRQYNQSEKGRAARKRYNKSEKGKAAHKRYHQSEKGKAMSAKCSQVRKDRHPEKMVARNAMSNALRNGRIVKIDNCEHCGDSPTVGHHTSYAEDMKLCITWLCDPCHRTLHNEHNERVRA